MADKFNLFPALRARARLMFMGFLCIIGGMLGLDVLDRIQAHTLADAPWVNALAVLDAAADQYPDAISARMRFVPVENFPGQSIWVDEFEKAPNGGQFLDQMGLRKTERFWVVDLPEEAIEGMLASGRIPDPDAHEVLRGPWARRDYFQIDGQQFTVVGVLKHEIAILPFAYLTLPSSALDPLFGPDTDARSAAFIRDGKTWLESHEDFAADTLIGGQVAAPASQFWLALGCLMVIAFGGCLAHVTFFLSWPPDPGSAGIFAPAIRVMREWPNALVHFHMGHFTVLFAAMIIGQRFPFINLVLTSVTQDAFSSGALAYVGDAYGSGSIFQAAYTTWLNNFIVQTVLVATLPSLLIFGWGIFKNVASFFFVGLVLAPVWYGAAGGFTLHSLTMVIELEAYILMSFFIFVYPIRMIRGLREGGTAHAFKQGLVPLGSGLLLAGLLLAIGALCEAVTLIHFI